MGGREKEKRKRREREENEKRKRRERELKEYKDSVCIIKFMWFFSLVS